MCEIVWWVNDWWVVGERIYSWGFLKGVVKL